MKLREFFGKVDDMPWDDDIEVVLANDVLGNYHHIEDIRFDPIDRVAIVFVGDQLEGT